jgi:hypothetical protein
LKGTAKIKLDAFKSKSKIHGQYAIELESKRMTPTIEVTLSLRQPILEKEYDVTSTTVLKINKIFPPFKSGEGKVVQHSQPTPAIKEEKKQATPVNTKKKEEDITGKTKQIASKDKKVETKTEHKAKIDPSEFTKEELEDPDVQDNMNSVKVLEFKIAKVQKEIDGIEGRAPAKLREKLVKFKVRKNVLESQLGETLSIESYILIMKKQLDKDRKLVQYFEENKMIEQGKKVAERIPLIVKEMEEAISFAKQHK